MAPKRRKVQKPRKAPGQPPAQQPPSPQPYEVSLSDHASEVYAKLYIAMKEAEERGEANSAHHTTFRMIEEAVKVFSPRNPTDPQYGLRGALSQYFRVKKGRHRICWAADSRKRRVCILFISESLRKEGDRSDPYVVFEKLIKSGAFDKLLRKLKE
jgi:mRNA-degrading endonuclease RelE of RelBE toxin-antitoxin system